MDQCAKKPERNPNKIYGQFLEILRVSNGYAVYDCWGRGNDFGRDGRLLPLAVCANKEELFKWVRQNWLDEAGR